MYSYFLLSSLIGILSFFPQLCFAQGSRIYNSQLQTLRCEQKGRLTPLPLLKLGSDETIQISFDEMSHHHRHYIYNVTHCNMQWYPTEGLFSSEVFLGNPNEVPIVEHTKSNNTTTLYTHYQFTFPSKELCPLISGNYRIRIFEDTPKKQLVAEVDVCAIEPLIHPNGFLASETDIDYYNAHQQLSLHLDTSPLTNTPPIEDIYVMALQNYRYDNAISLPPPTRITGQTLIWEHCSDLIFPAGNEYRHFELLSLPQASGQGFIQTYWHNNQHHTILQADKPRHNYLLLEDQNGTSVIRNIDNHNNNTESDYSFVHFSLHSSLLDGDIYINGQWTSPSLSSRWKMHYNSELQQYEACLFLKQGYYSYQYLFLPKSTQTNRPTLLTAPIEGDYYQSHNDYTILVYQCSPHFRYHRLIGTALIHC